ncbi:MAG: hypothetical protein KBT69_13125 [Oceanihabitans sp.]|jgi:hypothetical protein|nr:hypothetical protein [Oceanihabitans sp.]
MLFENSSISKQHTYIKKTLDFGTFYLSNKFVVSEMNDGIHLSWNKISEIIEMVQAHYGDDCRVGYISNRINSYSFEPNHWSLFFENYDFVIASVSVYYSELSYNNATLEKLFSKKSLKRSDSIEEAISWILNLEEFKKVH